MSEISIRLNFALDWKDYFRGAKLYMDSSKSQKYLRYTILGLIFVLFAISLWASGMFSCECESWEDFRYCMQYAFEDNWAYLVIYPILLLLIYSDIITKLMYRIAIKRSQYACVERLWVVTPDSLHVSFDKAESTIKWDFFNKWAEDKSYFALMHDKRTFYPMPKRSFANKEDIDMFRDLLKEKIISEK